MRAALVVGQPQELHAAKSMAGNSQSDRPARPPHTALTTQSSLTNVVEGSGET